MVEKKVSLETKMLLDFFESQGVTFVDVESGEEIEPISDNKGGKMTNGSFVKDEGSKGTI